MEWFAENPWGLSREELSDDLASMMMYPLWETPMATFLCRSAQDCVYVVGGEAGHEMGCSGGHTGGNGSDDLGPDTMLAISLAIHL